MTMTAFLPPISSCTLQRRFAACAYRRRPTAFEPVKEIAFTRSSSTIARERASPGPRTMFNTPSGTPASTKVWTTCAAQSGVRVAGLNTTAFPATSAGAIFHAGMATGKFHGVMQATTPSGSRTV